MKVPVRWIQEIFPNELSAQEVAEKLTQLGLEVEEVEVIQQGFTGVVVGKVLSAEKHPEADRLVVAKVTDGKEEVQVVCGAPNCREGLTVAFAKVGAVLGLKEEKPLKVKKSKIRGVESFGMLCSEKELGLSDDHEKISELDPDVYVLGKDFGDYFAEAVLEISLTPNLAHCFSILGIARELKASVGGRVQVPGGRCKETGKNAQEAVRLQVVDEKCKSYCCKVIENVQVKQSPDWLKKKLELIGQRPINNIVDITNLVMFEIGQPLHAFDLEKISGKKVVLRTAGEKEKIKTLDGEERMLHLEDLLICDERGPIALAGIMGGGDCEVSEFTTSVLLESAWFDPISIRKTSKRHGLTTEASKRFERGIDPLNVEHALEYAAALIQQIAGGEVLKGSVKEQKVPYLSKEVKLRVGRLNNLLGVSLSVSEVQELLCRLDFQIRLEEDVFFVTPPSWRADIHFEEDLIEEVARLYGYNNLALQKQSGAYSRQKHNHCMAYLVEKQARTRLLAFGLTEFVTCDLIGPKLLEIVHGSVKSEDGMVRVLNPTSIEQSFLRTSLLPGILQVVKYNIDRRNLDISGFEIGRIHYRSEELYKEETLAAAVFSGHTSPHHFGEKGKEVDFFTCKGIVEEFFAAFSEDKLCFERSSLPSFHPGQQAHILLDGKEIGVIGALHPHVLRRLDVEQQIFYAEWNLTPLHALLGKQKKMKPLAQFPGSERDWTVTIKAASWGGIVKKIEKAPSRFLESFALIDRYENKEKLGEGKANLTIRFFYRNSKRTLSQEEVEKEHQRILDFVQKPLAEEGISQ